MMNAVILIGRCKVFQLVVAMRRCQDKDSPIIEYHSSAEGVSAVVSVAMLWTISSPTPFCPAINYWVVAYLSLDCKHNA